MLGTVGASVFTYKLVHEPLETVGAFEVSHLASSHCNAIASTLRGLSLARSNVMSGEPDGARTDPDPNATIGVVNLGSGRLESPHNSSLSRQEAEQILRRLPLDPSRDPQAQSVRTALGDASSGLKADLAQHQCRELDDGLEPLEVRVYPIQGKPKGWLAFVDGPWTVRGARKASFALVNLSTNRLATLGHDQDRTLPQFFTSEEDGDELRMDLQVDSAGVLKDEASLHQALPKLDLEQDDQTLEELKIVPFANQLVSTQLSIDHRILNGMSWRGTGLVFVMGLLGTSIVVLVSRRSEIRLRRLNEALVRESRTDGLTRIANRRAWDEALNLEESRRQRHGYHYGLVVIDLNGFKQINDEQGHQMGDEVLQIAASQMAAQLRSSDLLARVGGDEFALLIVNPSAKGLEEFVERLRQALRHSGVDASIGAALSEQHATLEQTWAKADEAMYAVKSSRRPAESGPTRLD